MDLFLPHLHKINKLRQLSKLRSNYIVDQTKIKLANQDLVNSHYNFTYPSGTGVYIWYLLDLNHFLGATTIFS